tara:strand:+ start:10060 stop:10224 length:165 start_codon:yes stop_codon:yes gene_type:complete
MKKFLAGVAEAGHLVKEFFVNLAYDVKTASKTELIVIGAIIFVILALAHVLFSS